MASSGCVMRGRDKIGKNRGYTPVLLFTCPGWLTKLASCANQFALMVSQEAMQCSLVCCKALTFIYLTDFATYQVIEAGNVVAHLHLKMSFAIAAFYEETILFFLNRDA